MKKKLFKAIGIILIVALFIFALYNFCIYLRSGNQRIQVSTSNKYNSDSNIEAIIRVFSYKNNESIKSNLKVELLDSNGKKVKGVSEKYSLEKNDTASISIPIPKETKTGNYNLKITSKSGIWKDISETPIYISNGADFNTTISLDKGIYKPGDIVNFRALITSKKDDKPLKQNVTISIYDGNDNRVYRENTETSDYGIISGSFKLASEVNSGSYKIVVGTDSKESSKIFKVNPYITPQFEVEVKTDKDTYLINEKATVTIVAKYFFGEPVANATVSGNIGDIEINGITNSNGEFNTEYEVKKVGKTNINVSVVDNSNYLIESSKTIIGSTDIFEIEVLPEFGRLVKGIDNDIYIFTKLATGEPLKTYATVTIDKITRQVITDENGIGKLTLTSSDISKITSYNVNNYNNYYDYDDYEYNTSSNFSSTMKYEDNYYSDDINYYNYGTFITVVAEDMSKNEVSIKKGIGIEDNNSTVIKTDKVKYNTGDDININLYSPVDYSQNEIFIYKNNELIKMFSTNDDSLVVNLEDTYGLIDIYVKRVGNITNRNNVYDNYNKRTIFIKPNKSLNVSIDTDKDEYKPGDDLNLKIVTTDEVNKNVDSALLVSILDEAILNLENNDLSIDNIKLALEDIELTDEMSAADLYTNILDDSSETAIMGLLLKQSNKDPNIVSNIYNNISEKDSSLSKAVISIIILLVLVVIYVAIKSKRFSNLAFNLFNIVGIFIVLDFVFSASDFTELIINGIVTLVLYLLILYKIRDKIFIAIMELALLPAIITIIGNLILVQFDLEDYYLIFALIPILIFSILTAISRIKKLSNFWEICKKFFKTVCKVEIVYLLTYFITDKLDIYEEFWMLVVLLVIYVITNIVLNKKSLEKIKDQKIALNINGLEILGGIAGIIVIALIIYVYNDSRSTITESMTSMEDSYYIGDMPINSSSSTNSFKGMSIDSAVAEGGKSSSSSDIFDGISNIFNSVTDTKSETIAQEVRIDNSEIEERKDNESEYTTAEESVRNVFLESLVFIPELITENGEASSKIKISDNITTWNIQTVGNTKNGNVGYASSKFKVFKEFFVDYSMPTNSVVSDKTSIPVTLYNYTENDLEININVKENEWSKIGDYTHSKKVSAKSTSMIYVPIEILSSGTNKLRIEAEASGNTDIVEKTLEVKPNGFEEQKVISSGSMEKTLSQDIIFKEDFIEGTGKIKIKLYPSTITQALEGIENIFQMPTGCFEQTSSSLYPNILALKYLKDNKLDNSEIKEKALNYISSGYQRLLTFEVKSEKGGYSLYGDSPAESVITAFGLMELKDLTDVYDVDDNVINNMKEFLFTKQKSNGSFEYSSTYIGGAVSTNDLAMSAYITWALSEAYPEDNRLEKSVKYLENNIDKMNDNYTLALTANVFANTNNKKAKDVIDKLIDGVIVENDSSYITSSIRDYYGSYGNTQNLQTTALVSMALTKLNSNSKTNSAFINYIISKKDSYGTWGTTQATILSLKAINNFSQNSDISKQTISVKVNDDVKDIEINDNAIDLYELTFDNCKKENNISIDMKKGKIYYEIIQDYYVDYNNISTDNNEISVSQEIDKDVKVNDIITQKIAVENKSKDMIYNGMIEANIPQGCTVLEDSLMKLEYDGIIEKYEYNYGIIKLYLRNFKAKEIQKLEIKYRASYPENITGGSIRAYDYYNPEIEGFSKPVNISISE